MPDQTQIPSELEPVVVQVDDQAALQTYREGVESLLVLRSNKIITNGKPAHAAILFEIFFKNAKNRVRIFCRNLNRRVFDNERLIAEFRKAISPDRNVFVDILVQEDPEAIAFLAHARNANVRITRASTDVARQLDKNFAVMDDIAIRVEPNRNTVEAKAIMFAPEQAKAWNSFFDLVATT